MSEVQKIHEKIDALIERLSDGRLISAQVLPLAHALKEEIRKVLGDDAKEIIETDVPAPVIAAVDASVAAVEEDVKEEDVVDVAPIATKKNRTTSVKSE